MLDRLETALERERSFVDDASHELRTPLAAHKAELELALRYGASTEELRAAIASAIEEADRLSQLAESLLVIARSDKGRLASEARADRDHRPLCDDARPLERPRRARRTRAPLRRRIGRRRSKRTACASSRRSETSSRTPSVTVTARSASGPASSNGRIEIHVSDEGRRASHPNSCRTRSSASAAPTPPGPPTAPASGSRSSRRSRRPTAAARPLETRTAAARTCGLSWRPWRQRQAAQRRAVPSAPQPAHILAPVRSTGVRRGAIVACAASGAGAALRDARRRGDPVTDPKQATRLLEARPRQRPVRHHGGQLGDPQGRPHRPSQVGEEAGRDVDRPRGASDLPQARHPPDRRRGPDHDDLRRSRHAPLHRPPLRLQSARGRADRPGESPRGERRRGHEGDRRDPLAPLPSGAAAAQPPLRSRLPAEADHDPPSAPSPLPPQHLPPEPGCGGGPQARARRPGDRHRGRYSRRDRPPGQGAPQRDHAAQARPPAQAVPDRQRAVALRSRSRRPARPGAGSSTRSASTTCERAT